MTTRIFTPETSRRYGRPTLSPKQLVIDSPNYDFSKLTYFQFLPNRLRPLWVEKRSIVISIDGGCRPVVGGVAGDHLSPSFSASSSMTRRDSSSGSDSNADLAYTFAGVKLGAGRERAAYGVYFGCCSRHNFFGFIHPNLPQTSQRAEIEAAVQAVDRLDRLDLTHQRTPKVVIRTDSQYLFKNMTEWMEQRLATGGKKYGGGEAKYWDVLERLHRNIERIEREKGLKVMWWWVNREFNAGADELAGRAFESKPIERVCMGVF